MINDDYSSWPSFLYAIYAFHVFRTVSKLRSESTVSTKVQLDSTLPSVGPVKTSVGHSTIFNWLISSQHIEYQWISWLNINETCIIENSLNHTYTWCWLGFTDIYLWYSQRNRQVLEHLCAVCAQKAASKCGVTPRSRCPGLPRVAGAQRGVNMNSTWIQHEFNQSQDMSPTDRQTDISWSTRRYLEILGVCRLPKAAAKKSGTAQGRIRQVNLQEKMSLIIYGKPVQPLQTDSSWFQMVLK